MVHSTHDYRAHPRRLQIYNSLGGEKQPFEPLDSEGVVPHVKMYVCGLTPQDSSHLGHGLMALRFDMIRRYLGYRRLNVTFIQNVTDIEDKIIERVLRTGENPLEMTRRFTDEFYAILDKLHVLPLDRLTRVTEFVPQIIAFIEGLISKGFAYATEEGNVYFDVRKKADYGKLSNQNTDMLFESVRKELDKQKHSPVDFALWKRDESTSLSQPSPWGVGRPGWHIECSVMIYETLGARIDIHGGGLDLKFPHHENEIAQSEAYTGAPFANIWMHSGLLNINGQKMSKSLKNFVILSEGVERYGPAPLRFVIARHHYRSSVDLTDKLFRDNLNSLLEFHRIFDRFPGSAPADPSAPLSKELVEAFEEAMDNDFNSPEALVALEQARSRVLQALDSGKVGAAEVAGSVSLIRELGQVLGLFFHSTRQVEEQGLNLLAVLNGATPMTPEAIQGFIDERKQVRADKNFARSDEIRKDLATSGVELLDSKTGTTWRFC